MRVELGGALGRRPRLRARAGGRAARRRPGGGRAGGAGAAATRRREGVVVDAARPASPARPSRSSARRCSVVRTARIGGVAQLAERDQQLDVHDAARDRSAGGASPAGTRPRSFSTRVRTLREIGAEPLFVEGAGRRRSPPARPAPAASRRLVVGADHARPQERHPLPARRLLLVIALERLPRGHQQALLARGAQPGVDLVEAPLLQHRLHRRDEALRGARRTTPGDRRRSCSPRRAVEEDEVEVGAVAHLARAQAAEPQHRQGRAPASPSARGQRRHRRPIAARQADLGQIGQLPVDLARSRPPATSCSPMRSISSAWKRRSCAQACSSALPRCRPPGPSRARGGSASILARCAPRIAESGQERLPHRRGAGPADRPANRWCRTASPACAASWGSSRRSASNARRARQTRLRKWIERAVRIGRGDRLLEQRDRHARPQPPPGCRRRPRCRGSPPPPASRSSSTRSRIGSSRRCASAAPHSGGSPSVAAIVSTAARSRRHRVVEVAEAGEAQPIGQRGPRPRRRRGAGAAAPPSPPGPGARGAARTGTRSAASRPRDRESSPATTSRGSARGVLRSRRSWPLAGVQELQRLHDHLDVADPACPQLHVEAGLAQRAARVGGIAELAPAGRARPRPCLASMLRG